ncbi:cobalamin-binding protein [Almyronema epifaneia]|uniref:Cobalamin-binding protein n=1 Tax=Almyronema epifaneia S1 TaxID=2991925 RepID=A0ABW6IE56_9CYAN
MPDTPRIVSLIPSATEIVDLLGWRDALVGRSHECDYPTAIQDRPVCTQPKFQPIGTSQEIHDRVMKLLQTALSVYDVKVEVLEALRPTHILTQAQCEVCAVSLADVEQAIAELTHSQPQVISLEPTVLADVWQDIRRVAQCIGGETAAAEAEQAIAALQVRVQCCRDKTAFIAERPTVACIEWPEPLMAAGNWVPELVELAGGRCLFGTAGEQAPWLEWSALVAADPDIIVVMPCGYDLVKTRQELAPLTQTPEWDNLKAVNSERVYLTDGNQYFNRPGPRLADSLEILAEIFHPDLFDFGYRGQAWQKL